MKQVKLKKNEFENRGLSILVALSSVCNPSGLYGTQESLDFNEIFQHKEKTSDWDLEEKNQSVLLAKH